MHAGYAICIDNRLNGSLHSMLGRPRTIIIHPVWWIDLAHDYMGDGPRYKGPCIMIINSKMSLFAKVIAYMSTTMAQHNTAYTVGTSGITNRFV